MNHRRTLSPSIRYIVVIMFVTVSIRTTSGGQWAPITCVPADLPPEAMFEMAKGIDDVESADLRWQAILGGQNTQCRLARDETAKREGKASLRVDYDFVGKSDYEYIQINIPLEIPEAGYAFGFWLDDAGASFPIRVRIVDRNGETHQVELFSSKHSGWQFVAGSLDGRSTSWGGDGNGRREYPCQLVGICLDRPRRGFVGQGSLWLDDVALLHARDLPRTLNIETDAPKFGNLFAVGESVSLKAAGKGDAIRWAVTDFRGQQLAQGEAAAAEATARFKLDRPGYFCCRLELLRRGEPVEVQLFCCAALSGAAESARSDFAGVCSHYGQNNYPLPSMDLMQRYGIDQFRDEISWRSYEREKGRYTMPSHAAAYLEHATRLQMRPLIIFDYNNPLYDNDGYPNSPEAIAAFSAYAVDLARQTRGTVAMFEVWNEWIGGCGMDGRPGDHGPEAYGRLMKGTYLAVKKAFPDLTIVGIGGEYGPECANNIVRSLKVAGSDAMDAWSIHPYRYPRSPEQSDLVGELKRIAETVAGTGATQNAWVTEIGWPTHRTPGGSTEAAQARHCVRALVLMQSSGVVEKVFWYDFKDDGTRRDYNEHNFGLIRHQTYNCAPKPGVVAMSVFIRMTGGADFVQLQQHDDVYTAHYRHGDGREVIVAWTTNNSRQISISGDIQAAVDIMGADLPVTDAMELTENPVYVVGRKLKTSR